MSSAYCLATRTSDGRVCSERATFLVGVPGMSDGWRDSCRGHLANVVEERMATLDLTHSVVVAPIRR